MSTRRPRPAAVVAHATPETSRWPAADPDDTRPLASPDDLELALERNPRDHVALAAWRDAEIAKAAALLARMKPLAEALAERPRTPEERAQVEWLYAEIEARAQGRRLCPPVVMAGMRAEIDALWHGTPLNRSIPASTHDEG